MFMLKLRYLVEFEIEKYRLEFVYKEPLLNRAFNQYLDDEGIMWPNEIHLVLSGWERRKGILFVFPFIRALSTLPAVLRREMVRML
jgi:hypothetical protein